eukprot:GEMP01025656.1.p1 GENE.GEMP01025656.1~~GEMP01025656.1.p1  ORF type:complete len:440 (+),score=98.24 GEMP01025656.1:59-1378(+)
MENKVYIGPKWTSLSQSSQLLEMLPSRIRELMPSPEPNAPSTGWVYRVAEPYYTKDNVDDVMSALLSSEISSGAVWPRRMEEAICKLYGCPVALPTSSGASALMVALLCCGNLKNTQVLVPAMTMVAVANAVKLIGAEPVYCDSAVDGINPGIGEYMAKVTPRTKAIIVCHTYGVAMPEIEELAKICRDKGWWLIEDICESMGTKAPNGQLVGTFGDFAAASLYANKPITAGDGGWVHLNSTNDENRTRRLKSLVNHGFDPYYHFLHFEIAPNAKISGLAAALCARQIPTLPERVAHRGDLARAYRRALSAHRARIRCLQEAQIDAPWVFGVECNNRKDRDALRDHLAQNRIETRSYFVCLHVEPVNFFEGDITYEIPLPRAEHLSQIGLYLPTHNFLTIDDVEYIVAVIIQFYDGTPPPECKRSPGWAHECRTKLLQC